MIRGLHLLGVDAKRTASAVTAALAEGFAQGATRQRADGGAKAAQAQAQAAQVQAQAAQAKASSNTVWYVAGAAAVVAVVVALLVRR